ncbi:hypothetical protein TNCV_1469731 [Trichonephila clavipes]|nr:hypothetical protein TNCV_1469731 [Trichonephila clavipes]
MLWGRQVAGRNYPPTNKNTLIRALTEEWDKLPQQLLDNVVQSMHECTMRYDRELRHTSSVGCLEIFRFIFAVTLPLVHSNSWDAQLVVPNDSRYAWLETNLGIGQAKEE